MTTPLPPEAVTRAQDADDDWMFEYGGHKLPADHITALLDAAAPVIEARARAAEREQCRATVLEFADRNWDKSGPVYLALRVAADLLGGETP